MSIKDKPSRRAFDGIEVESGPGPQRFEIYEPGWWQLGRWLHWWKFRRYHGRVDMTLHPGNGKPYKISLRVVPSRTAAHGDAPTGYSP